MSKVCIKQTYTVIMSHGKLLACHVPIAITDHSYHIITYVLFQHEVTGNTKCSLLNYIIRETNNENCVSPCVGTYSWHFDLILVATSVDMARRIRNKNWLLQCFIVRHAC